jgi:hypothetical protein
MQALSDDQQMERLEQRFDSLDRKVDAKVDALERKVDAKVDALERKVDGFMTETRAEFRAVRAEIGGINRTILAMWLTMIFGFAAILLQQHL